MFIPSLSKLQFCIISCLKHYYLKCVLSQILYILFSPKLFASFDSCILITDAYILYLKPCSFFYCHIFILLYPNNHTCLGDSLINLYYEYGQTEFHHNTLLKNFQGCPIIYRIKFQHFRTYKPDKENRVRILNTIILKPCLHHYSYLPSVAFNIFESWDKEIEYPLLGSEPEKTNSGIGWFGQKRF